METGPARALPRAAVLEGTQGIAPEVMPGAQETLAMLAETPALIVARTPALIVARTPVLIAAETPALIAARTPVLIVARTLALIAAEMPAAAAVGTWRAIAEALAVTQFPAARSL
jgi:hypothetical protein